MDEGPDVRMRALDDADHDALAALLMSLPPGEHMFLHRAMDEPGSVRAWIADTPAWWTGAFAADRLVGAAAVVPGQGWSSHVGELRMVVAPTERHSGTGAALARVALVSAIERGCLVVTVAALAEQAGVLRLFAGLGFTAEALLSDHVREADGTLHDLVVMTHSVVGAASSLGAVGTTDDP